MILISRKSTRLVAEAYSGIFRKQLSSKQYIINVDAVYDFLYDRDFPAYFCNLLKQNTYTRSFKESIMKLHTGETLATGTPKWTWEQREALAQKYLYDMAESIIQHKDTLEERFYSYQIRCIEDLVKQLELDGYTLKNGKLLISEAEILDTKEEIGVIESLYVDLELDNKETAFHHLELSNEHYINNKWDDSISNSRKFLECILREVASSYSTRILGVNLDSKIYSNQKNIRNYLEKQGLLESKERESINSIYGLLSETGGHPYMAQSEQARLLRHLSLTFSQFVMLRLRGALK